MHFRRTVPITKLTRHTRALKVIHCIGEIEPVGEAEALQCMSTIVVSQKRF